MNKILRRLFGVRVGDFINAEVDLPELFPYRQGLYIGNKTLLTENGNKYTIVNLKGAVVVEVLTFPSTIKFVENWKREHGRL